jgi:hypothetical protein
MSRYSTVSTGSSGLIATFLLRFQYQMQARDTVGIGDDPAKNVEMLKLLTENKALEVRDGVYLY